MADVPPIKVPMIIDLTGYKSGLDSAASAMSALFEDIIDDAKRAGKEAERVARQTQREAERAARRQMQLTREMANLERRTQRESANMRRMIAQQEERRRLEASAELAKREIADLKRVTDAFIREIANRRRVEREAAARRREIAGVAADGLGLGLGATALIGGGMVGAGALAAGMGRATVEANQFNHAMRQVRTLVQEMGQRDFNNLSDAVRRMAIDMGGDGVDAAMALKEAFSSQMPAKEAMNVLRDIGKTSVATAESMQNTQAVFSSIINSYINADEKVKLTWKDTAHIGDVLFGVIDKGAISMEQLSQQIGDVTPFAGMLGVSLEEVGAALAAITIQRGPKSAAEAATALKNMFMTMLKLSPKAEDEINGINSALKSLGSTLRMDISKEALQKGGLAGVLQNIKAISETLGGVRTEKIFPNIRGFLAAYQLLGTASGAFNQTLTELQTNMGAMDRAFAIMQDRTLATHRLFEGMKLVLNDLQNDITTFTVAVIRDMTGIDLESRTADWGKAFEDLSFRIRQSLAIIARAFLDLAGYSSKSLVILARLAEVAKTPIHALNAIQGKPITLSISDAAEEVDRLVRSMQNAAEATINMQQATKALRREFSLGPVGSPLTSTGGDFQEWLMNPSNYASGVKSMKDAAGLVKQQLEADKERTNLAKERARLEKEIRKDWEAYINMAKQHGFGIMGPPPPDLLTLQQQSPNWAGKDAEVAGMWGKYQTGRDWEAYSSQETNGFGAPPIDAWTEFQSKVLEVGATYDEVMNQWQVNLDEYGQVFRTNMIDTFVDMVDTITDGLAQAFTALILNTGNATEILQNMGKQVLAMFLQMLIKLALQSLLFAIFHKAVAAEQAATDSTVNAANTYGATFASVMAALPFPANIAAAPVISGAAVAAMITGQTVAGTAAGASSKAAVVGSGDFGGMSFDKGGVVPGFVGKPVKATIHGGEVVVTPLMAANLIERIGRGEHAGVGGGRQPATINIYAMDSEDVARAARPGGKLDRALADRLNYNSAMTVARPRKGKV